MNVQQNYETTQHPVIRLLDASADYLRDAGGQLGALDYPSPHASLFIRRILAPMAEAAVELESFTLEPTELLDIWRPRVDKLSDRPLRYKLAGILTGAYAVQGAISTEWRELPLSVLMTSQLPSIAAADRHQLAIVDARVEEVMENVRSTALIARSEEDKDLAYEVRENFVNGVDTLHSRIFNALSDTSEKGNE